MADIEDVEVKELPAFIVTPSPCAFCGETGKVVVGWDEEGDEVFSPCGECGGDGLQDN